MTETDTKHIIAWSLGIVWSDGEEDIITDIPHGVSSEIDDFLDELERQVNE